MKLFCYLFLKSVILLRNKVHVFGGPYLLLFTAMQNRSLTQIPCYLCHQNTVQEIPWFVGSSKSYYCLSRCKEHGYLRGKIRFKKSENGKIFCIRTVKQISSENACKISEMQRTIREKKRLKRREETMVTHKFHSV